MWYEKYIGTPWASPANPPKTFNCGDLARYVYKNELGLDTAEIHIGCHNFKSHVREVESYFDRAGFIQVQEKEPFDIVRMYLGKRACHIGIYTGKGVLHSLEGTGVIHESIFDLKSTYRMEFMRHVSRLQN